MRGSPLAEYDFLLVPAGQRFCRLVDIRHADTQLFGYCFLTFALTALVNEPQPGRRPHSDKPKIIRYRCFEDKPLYLPVFRDQPYMRGNAPGDIPLTQFPAFYINRA